MNARRFKIGDRVEITEGTGEYGTIDAISPDHHLPYLVKLDDGRMNYFRLDRAVLKAHAAMAPRAAFIYGYYVAKIESLAAIMQFLDGPAAADIRGKIMTAAGNLWDALNEVQL